MDRGVASLNWPERLANGVLGFNVLGWGVAAAFALAWGAQPTEPRFAAIAVNVVVGLLFLVRAPVRRHGGAREFLSALPSLVCSGLLFRTGLDHGTWGLPSDAVLVLGTVVAIGGLLSLGRSFAILPAARPLATRGLYRVVRHPVYLGEFAMCVACFMAAPGWVAGGVLAMLFGFMTVRILAEESFLKRSGSYAGYAAVVRHRLLPGVW